MSNINNDNNIVISNNTPVSTSTSTSARSSNNKNDESLLNSQISQLQISPNDNQSNQTQSNNNNTNNNINNDTANTIIINADNNNNNNNNNNKNNEEVHIPVSELYHQAQKLHNDITNSKLNSNDPQRQSLVKQATQMLLKVYRAVRASGVFSSNEELDDINTVDLKYVLVAFYLGDLTMAVTDMEQRSSNIRMALAYFNTFLSHCEKLKLMHKEDVQTFQRKTEVASPAQAREEKISRAKREQSARKQLQLLLQKREITRKRQHGNLDDDSEDIDDEELERNIIKSTIEAAVVQSLNHVKFGNEELAILKQMDTMRIQGQSSQPRAEPQSNNKPPVVYRIPAPGAAPQRIVLGNGAANNHNNNNNNRQNNNNRNISNLTAVDANILRQVNAQSHVFRDPNAPLYTPEQWYDIQAAQGLLPEPMTEKQREKQAKESEEKERRIEETGDDGQPDPDNQEAVDHATYEAREWDNWKDEHEKGAGNKMYRR